MKNKLFLKFRLFQVPVISCFSDILYEFPHVSHPWVHLISEEKILLFAVGSFFFFFDIYVDVSIWERLWQMELKELSSDMFRFNS